MWIFQALAAIDEVGTEICLRYSTRHPHRRLRDLEWDLSVDYNNNLTCTPNLSSYCFPFQLTANLIQTSSFRSFSRWRWSWSTLCVCRRLIDIDHRLFLVLIQSSCLALLSHWYEIFHSLSMSRLFWQCLIHSNVCQGVEPISLFLSFFPSCQLFDCSDANDRLIFVLSYGAFRRLFLIVCLLSFSFFTVLCTRWISLGVLHVSTQVNTRWQTESPGITMTCNGFGCCFFLLLLLLLCFLFHLRTIQIQIKRIFIK